MQICKYHLTNLSLRDNFLLERDHTNLTIHRYLTFDSACRATSSSSFWSNSPPSPRFPLITKTQLARETWLDLGWWFSRICSSPFFKRIHTLPNCGLFKATYTRKPQLKETQALSQVQIKWREINRLTESSWFRLLCLFLGSSQRPPFGIIVEMLR